MDTNDSSTFDYIITIQFEMPLVHETQDTMYLITCIYCTS